MVWLFLWEISGMNDNRFGGKCFIVACTKCQGCMKKKWNDILFLNIRLNLEIWMRKINNFFKMFFVVKVILKTGSTRLCIPSISSNIKCGELLHRPDVEIMKYLCIVFCMFKDKHNIAILWYGKEWQATLRFLLKHKIAPDRITILDGWNISQENSDFLSKKRIAIISGSWYLDQIDTYDIIIKSPGISPYTHNLSHLAHKITSQTQIFFDLYTWPVIAVTATKWKSTICSLLHAALQNQWYKTLLVGNIGQPVLDILDPHDTTTVYDYIVYEISSYMLDGLRKHNLISVLGNMYQDHIDRHGSVEAYHNAKKNILTNSTYCLVHQSIKQDIVRQFPDIQCIWYWTWSDFWFDNSNFLSHWLAKTPTKDVRLLWDHNKENISCLFALASIIPLDDQVLTTTIQKFVWLDHRLQYIWTYQDILFYDDAISTTPQSTIQAINALPQTQTIFLWWTDRGYDFTSLVECIRTSAIKNIVLFPETWKRLIHFFEKSHRILSTSSMQEAIAFAYRTTTAWWVCLLSCASPSYSLRKNFEEKWNQFAHYAREFKP